MNRWLLLCTAVSFAVAPLSAVSADGRWHVRVWRSDDGLPNNYVTGLAETPDGYLWVATYSCLARFDGVRFEEYYPHKFAGVDTSKITALQIARDGSLWVGSLHGAVLRLNRRGARVFSAGLPEKQVQTLLVGADGIIYNYYGGTVYRIKNDAVSVFGKNQGVPPEQDPAGSLTTDDFRYLARNDPSDSGLVLMEAASASSGLHGPIEATLEMVRAHHLLPEGYIQGMAVFLESSSRRPAFMDGHWKAGGWKSFFPYALWAKTPPALFPLLALGFLGIWRRRLWFEVAPFIVLTMAYSAVDVMGNVNIGHRHILPIYPVLYIIAGGAVFAWQRYRGSLAVTAVLVGCFVADAMWVWPHCFSYFSPAVGGPRNGYRRLVDSSLDWGQDLPALEHAIDILSHGSDSRVYLSYFGTGDPDYYGVKAFRLPGYPDWREKEVYAYQPGIYAISATLFQNVYTPDFGPWNQDYEREYQADILTLGLTEVAAKDTSSLCAAVQKLPDPQWQAAYGRYEALRFNRLCAWLRASGRHPDFSVGGSILLWQISESDLRDALWGRPAEGFERPALSYLQGL